MQLFPALWRIWRVLTILFLLAAVSAAAWSLVQWLDFLFRLPLSGDARIYHTVGKGLLSGYALYGDLFETKPPGVFVLHVLSLVTTGGPAFMNIIEVLSSVATAGLASILVLQKVWKAQDNRRVSLILLSITLALIFAIHLASRTFGGRAEAFGVPFVLLSLAGMTWTTVRFTKTKLAIIALGIAGALGMKEPFLLSIIAAALLIIPFHRWPRDVLLPLLIALLAGAFLLLCAGWFGSYTSLYLPEMLVQHSSQADPLWMRMLLIELLRDDLHETAPQLPLLAGLFCVLAAVWALQIRSGWKSLGSVLLLALGVYLFVFPLGSARILWGLTPPLLTSPFLVLAALASMIAGYIFLWKTDMQRALAIVSFFVVLMASVLLIMAAIGSGGAYYDHHFAFAIPVLVVIAALGMRALNDADDRLWVCLLSGAIMLVLPVSLSLQQPNSTLIESARQKRATHAPLAQELDAILMNCGWERYLMVGGGGEDLWSQTRHSPYGRIFAQFDLATDPRRPRMRSAFIQNLKVTPIIVQNPAGDAVVAGDTVIAEMLTAQFTNTAPACAGTSALGPYRLLYRR